MWGRPLWSAKIFPYIKLGQALLALIQRLRPNYVWCGIGTGCGGFAGGGPPGVTGRGAGTCFVSRTLCVTENGLGKNVPLKRSPLLSVKPLEVPSRNVNVTWSFGWSMPCDVMVRVVAVADAGVYTDVPRKLSRRFVLPCDVTLQ